MKKFLVGFGAIMVLSLGVVFASDPGDSGDAEGDSDGEGVLKYCPIFSGTDCDEYNIGKSCRTYLGCK